MKKTLFAVLICFSLAAAAECYTHSYFANGKYTTCTTCCYGNSCNTTCY